jgi:hypothetical protein
MKALQELTLAEAKALLQQARTLEELQEKNLDVFDPRRPWNFVQRNQLLHTLIREHRRISDNNLRATVTQIRDAAREQGGRDDS